ncbi:conserved protein of unknown function [Bradyrhizobium sp. ORS 285]|uniref:hypothetical protein n=1 Tax=Bradyrhizobium sp. ORS 285 TaxID=115808 RepID=UPI000240A579|nr:hypothetical protein [Bradyrhizobium sp. ORS 285]CCD85259.1 conserved hypothetical protein [Bradyrhizobium sp. ORS 285]SMX57490.1 conserved protein of unknown function [Bradyrhizobium sp. ORS 285]
MEVEIPKKRRRRVKQTMTLGERLLQTAREARDMAKRLPPGIEQARQLRRAREAEAIVELERFLTGPARSTPPRSR